MLSCPVLELNHQSYFLGAERYRYVDLSATETAPLHTSGSVNSPEVFLPRDSMIVRYTRGVCLYAMQASVLSKRLNGSSGFRHAEAAPGLSYIV